MQTVTTEDAKRLPEVIDLIHDCWFDLRDLVFDSRTGVLRVRFHRDMPEQRRTVGRFLLIKKVQVPTVECFLNIHHVIQYSVEDMARVGKYDFNTVLYDEGRKHILITTGVPLRIEIEVAALKIEVEITDVVIGERSSLAIGFP